MSADFWAGAISGAVSLLVVSSKLDYTYMQQIFGTCWVFHNRQQLLDARVPRVDKIIHLYITFLMTKLERH